MASQEDIVTLPAASAHQTYVQISALDAGHLTLPERLLVTDADPDKRATVPSLSFLIQHPPPASSSNTERIIFDLGLKRNLAAYRSAQQDHISNRQPTIVSPDAAESLRKGGLEPTDMDTVMLSHVHWDHVGTPSDFSNAEFVVGSGTMHLLANGGGPLYPAALFNADELPADRTRELPPLRDSDPPPYERQTSHKWAPLAGFPAAIDYFDDGSLYVIDAPGHLYGHVNLLARTAPRKWVYLGGDCCHDPRILSGEKGIALYEDGKGGMRSVHVNTEMAAGTVEKIKRLLREGKVEEKGAGVVDVEVVVAHDGVWREKNGERFWPGHF